jgi:hypothetical protein
MSLLDNIKIPSANNTEGSSTGLVSNIKPVAQVAPASSGLLKDIQPKKDTQSDPYFYGTTTDGATIGRSDQNDSSGKPFFAYRNPGDTSTTTDKTRVATTFDPRIAQKLDAKTYYNPRAIEERTKVKRELGAAYNDDLDHQIALELSGSNNRDNLSLQPANLNRGAFAQKENLLAKKVAAGEISLFEAQVEDARQKGKALPWTVYEKLPGIDRPFTKDEQQKFNPPKIEPPKDAKPGDVFTGPDGQQYKVTAPSLHELGQSLYEAVNPSLELSQKNDTKTSTVSFDPNARSDVLNVLSALAPGIVAAGQSIIQKNPKPYIDFFKNAAEKLNYHGLVTKGQDGKLVVDRKKAEELVRLTMNFVGSAPVDVSADAARKAAEEYATQEFGKEVARRSEGNLPEGTTFYHGASAETAAKIKESGFIPSPDFPGDGMVNLTDSPGIAQNYAGPTGETLPVSISAKNTKVYSSMNQYENAIEAAPGATAGEKEVNLNKAFDLVRIKNADAHGDDLILAKPNILKLALPAPQPEKFQGFSDLSTTILEKLKGRASVSKQFIADLAKGSELKLAERGIINSVLENYKDQVPVKEFADKVKAELLPLERESTHTQDGAGKTTSTGSRSSPRYENIVLPKSERGPIENYSEHIYKSPVKTSAGDIHFRASKGAENYFGHTRVEDLPGNTRRVIEVQSDLYQKGNLDREENMRANNFSDSLSSDDKKTLTELANDPKKTFWNDLPADIFKKMRPFGLSDETVYKLAKEGFPESTKDVLKLNQYNDPTAHFRMVREEIKQAAKDGKAKLQFPTGETGMKIEQLSRADAFRGMDESGALHDPITPQGLRAGRLVGDIGGRPWIITEVLENGKFRAMRKSQFEAALMRGNYTRQQFLENIRGDAHTTETFDISGKVDTNNPVYKFYEKTLGRYLAKNFGAKTVVDPQGVKWFELPISKEMATKPVIAHKYHTLLSGPKAGKEIGVLIKKMLPGTDIKIVFDKDLLKNTGALGLYKSYHDLFSGELKQVIRLYEKGGKVSARAAFHEAYHALEDAMPASVRKTLDKDTLVLMSEKDKQFYRDQGYKENELASEFRADEWGKQQADKVGYKSKIQKVLDSINAFIKKIIDTSKAIYERIKETPNKQGGFAKNIFSEDDPVGKLIKKGEGELPAAFKNENIGEPIDLLWGKATVGEKGGYGLAKIQNKHPEVLPYISEAIKTAHIDAKRTSQTNRKITILESAPTDTIPSIRFIIDHQLGTPEGIVPKTFLNNAYFIVPREGLEPTTSRSSNERSTIELPRRAGILPKTDESVKSDMGIKTDYKTNERGNAEVNKELRKQAPGITAQADKKISELNTIRETIEDTLKNSPARKLARYVNKNGELPEALGRGGVFGKTGDEIANELGFTSSEAARLAYADYKFQQRRLTDIKQQLADIRSARAGMVKEDKDAKSLRHILEKTARSTDEIIRKQERLAAIRKADEVSAKKLAEEKNYELAYQQKVADARAEAAKSKGIVARIRARLNPLKSLDPKTKSIFTGWFTKKGIAKQIAQDEFIAARDLGVQNFEEITLYQAGKQTPYIRDAFDSMQTEFIRRGLNIHYIDNYVPQVWKNTAKEFDLAAKNYLKERGLTDAEVAAYMNGVPLPEAKALRLKLRPNFVKARFWPDYVTGMKHGLKPQYQTPAQLIAYYRESGETAIANRELISELKQEAKLLPGDEAPDTWVPVTIRFSREGLYAPREIADLINGQFRDEENLTVFEWVAKGGSIVSKTWQELKLSAGIPFSSINYFTIGQAIKLWTTAVGETAMLKFPQALSSLKASFSLIRSNSNAVSAKFFYDNRDMILLAARNGIDVTGNVGSYKGLYRQFKGVGLKDKVGLAFSRAFNEKTFSSMMPQITIQIFKDTYQAALADGLDPLVAENHAAEVTAAFTGIVRENGRGATTKQTVSSLFFAPAFRENLINVFVNAAKGFSTEFKNPAYSKSRALLVGMAVTLVLYDLLNKKLNGHHLWDNPPGREFSLRIPLKNGSDVLYTDFMPSFLAMPRAAGTGILALIKGDLSTVAQKAGSFFSMPIRTGFDLMANKDYFGNPIWKDTDTAAQRIKKGAEYVGVAANHPFISETYKYWAGKQPLYQSIVYMMELPAKFSSLDKEAKSSFYAAQDKKKMERAREVERLRPVYDKNQVLKADGKIDEANAVYDALSDGDKEIYDSIKASAKRAETVSRKPFIQKTYDDNQKLIEEGRYDEANAVYDGLSVSDRRIYDNIKHAAQK